MNSYKFKSILFLIPLIISCSKTTNLIKISAWGSDLSATKPVLESGLFNGEKYDYVVSSYPVITSVIQSNSNLKIYEDITSKFSSKFEVNGFPQAGLFINTELENNEQKADLVKSFLSSFDSTINKLLSKDDIFSSIMNKYSTDLNEQTNYFGFNSKLLNNLLIDNKMAFISNVNNPNIDEFDKFNNIFEYSINEEKLSKYYFKSYSESNNDIYSLKISAPFGAPSATLLPLKYDLDDKLNDNISFTTPLNIRASLLSGNKDFVIFDSTTGINISDKYKLVRMITYGNLYLISTGNDSNNTLDSEDKIFGYGEELITGKVTKAVYEKK